MARDDPLKVPRRDALRPPLHLVPAPRERQGVKDRRHEHVLVRQVLERVLPLGLPVEPVQEGLVHAQRVDPDVNRGGVEQKAEQHRLAPAHRPRLPGVGQHLVRSVHAPHQQGFRFDDRHRHRVLRHVQHHVGDQHRLGPLVIKRGVDEPRVLKVSQRAPSNLQGVVLDLVRPRHGADARAGIQREVLGRSPGVVRNVRVDGDVHREGPVLLRDPDVGGWELLAEGSGVDLVLDRGAAHHDVLDRTVLGDDGREHVHELLRRRHRVVHPQAPVCERHNRHPHVHEHVQQTLQLVERPHLPGHHLVHRGGLAPVGREGERPPVRVPPLGMRLSRRLGPEVLLKGDDIGSGVVERDAGERGERGGGDGRRRGEETAARRVHRPVGGGDGLERVVVVRGASRNRRRAGHGGAAIGAGGGRSETGLGRGGDARDVRDGGHVGDVHGTMRVRRGGTGAGRYGRDAWWTFFLRFISFWAIERHVSVSRCRAATDHKCW